MYPDELARKLYSEIADVEEEHVTQYGVLGDPEETMLEKMAMMELCEAYNYYSCAQTETDDRIKRIWENFTKMEITHFKMCAELLRKYEGKNIGDLMQEDKIKSLIVFEPNKGYVNKVLEEQIDLMPNNMEFVKLRELPDNWSSFKAQQIMNSGMVPSEEVVNRLGTGLAEKANQDIYQDVKQQMADRIGSSAVQMAISK
jgi:rubrerythrin